MLNNILGNLFNNLNYKKNGTKENFYSFSEMDNLQWIEIHRRNISRPDGTYIATTAKGKKKSREPAARLIYKGQASV